MVFAGKIIFLSFSHKYTIYFIAYNNGYKKYNHGRMFQKDVYNTQNIEQKIYRYYIMTMIDI